MKVKRISSNQVQSFETQHYTLLRTIAPECMVLLKKNKVFPLTGSCEIALYGSGARQTIKGGSGSGDVNVRHFVSVEEGLEKAGFTVTSKAWLDEYDRAKETIQSDFHAAIKKQAEEEGKSAILVAMGKRPSDPHYAFTLDAEADVCLYVLARNSGEGSDRTDQSGDYQLSEEEIRDILACSRKYPKFMLVLNVGGPVDLSPVLEHVNNILLLSQLGIVTGDALADVLLGKSSPSGKLTTTWASIEDYPFSDEFGASDDTRYREGIYVGYRWFDMHGIKPIFPFGYGLSWTEFETTVMGCSVENANIRVHVKVKNEGNYAGKEVLQLYYSAPQGRLDKPRRELGSFEKTALLLPGAKEELMISLPIENMASWDAVRKAWLLEKGDYRIFIGTQAVAVIHINSDVYTAESCDACGGPDFADIRPMVQSQEALSSLLVLRVDTDQLKNRGHFDRARVTRNHPDTLTLTEWTDEDLARACTGKFNEAQGLAVVIGNAAYQVAGAAGETADVIRDKGYGKLVFADGPAGLRLNTSFIETMDGAEAVRNETLEHFLDYFDAPVQQMLRQRMDAVRKKTAMQPIYYQYASAIPIGTALAQTWNPEVPYACGEIVGEEMELFGIHVWLAPALNIHRNPLCGRNFEYYSEDPLISGRTAAAITRGVQKRKGCAVTIKHFCCNNQETNRFASNSVVSERALREIYLKGFEICVKESAPKALMTSYNLLNSIHTANRRDLLTDILRGEWGFDGLVMTDWGTTSGSLSIGKYAASDPALCIAAGNDLIMPGSTADIDSILVGIQNGSITRKDLETSAGRIIRMSQELYGRNAQ